MSQRVIAVCVVLFVLATLGFSWAMYREMSAVRSDAGTALGLAHDATQYAERVRRETRIVTIVLPRLHERVVALEQETTALRETLLETPAMTARIVHPVRTEVRELGQSIADIRDEVRVATTAARAANAQSSAAHAVAAEALDVATVAYNVEVSDTLVKILEELDVQQGNFKTLLKDMGRIRELGRDRRALLCDYDDLFAQSLHLQLAMLQNATAYNSLATHVGEEFLKRCGLPSVVNIAVPESQ